MPRLTRGLVAGLVATVVLSMLMVLKQAMGLLPQLDVIGMLAAAMRSTRTAAWIVHLAVGVAWGAFFAAAYPRLPGGGPVARGLAFATVAWILMMLLVMPLAGVGLFAVSLGVVAPLATWALHLVFGAVLGAVFGRPAEG